MWWLEERGSAKKLKHSLVDSVDFSWSLKASEAPWFSDSQCADVLEVFRLKVDLKNAEVFLSQFWLGWGFFSWKGGYRERFSCRTCFASFSLLFACLAVGFACFVMVSNRQNLCDWSLFKGIVWVGPPPFPVIVEKWRLSTKKSQHPDCDHCILARGDNTTDSYFFFLGRGWPFHIVDGQNRAPPCSTWKMYEKMARFTP